jgi:hypothetical protein
MHTPDPPAAVIVAMAPEKLARCKAVAPLPVAFTGILRNNMAVADTCPCCAAKCNEVLPPASLLYATDDSKRSRRACTLPCSAAVKEERQSGSFLQGHVRFPCWCCCCG